MRSASTARGCSSTVITTPLAAVSLRRSGPILQIWRRRKAFSGGRKNATCPWGPRILFNRARIEESLKVTKLRIYHTLFRKYGQEFRSKKISATLLRWANFPLPSSSVPCFSDLFHAESVRVKASRVPNSRVRSPCCCCLHHDDETLFPKGRCAFQSENAASITLAGRKSLGVSQPTLVLLLFSFAAARRSEAGFQTRTQAGRAGG